MVDQEKEYPLIQCAGYDDEDGHHVCATMIEKKSWNTKRCQGPGSCSEKNYLFQTKESKKRADQREAEKSADTSSISKKEAYRVMEDLGIKTPAVQDILWDRANEIVSLFKLEKPIIAFFAHGPHLLMEMRHRLVVDAKLATVEAIKKSGIRSIEDFSHKHVVPKGELITLIELYALWAFFTGFYQVYEKNTAPTMQSFKDCLRLRHDCKTDVLALGAVLGKDFHPTPHGDWADFLPYFNPDSLKPGYSEEDLKVWFREQYSKDNGSIRDYLLMCARNHYKSTFSIVWMLTAVLCCPDVRILLCSITKDMALGFMNLFQSYWKWSADPALEQFQRLFPEYMIKPSDGKEKVFISPMSHITRPQKTAQITSLETGDTGSRFDLLVGDDIIDENGSKQPEQREKAMASYDEKWRFREAGVGFTITIGTPKHPEDLYAELVKRAQLGELIATHISAAWIVKSPWRELMALPKNSSNRLDIHDLTADMVDLLFPSRWPFDELMKELGTTPRKERTFRSEYLIEWVSVEADEVLNFSEQRLRDSVIMISALPEMSTDTIITVDTARSQSRYADNSAITALRLVRMGGRWVLIVLHQEAGKWNAEDKAGAIARFFCAYNPRMILIETPADLDFLKQKIDLQFLKQNLGYPPVYWLPVDNSKDAKFIRVKACADLLPDQLKFVSGPYIEDLFSEAAKLDGKGTKMTSRNDRWDSISLGVRFWKDFLIQIPKTEEQVEAERQAEETAPGRSHWYDRLFRRNSIFDSDQPDKSNWEGRSMHQEYSQTGQITRPSVDQAEPEPVGPANPRGATIQEAARRIFGSGSPYRV